MARPTERISQRNKRIAVSLGILLAIVGGFAIAAGRDGEPATPAGSSPAAENAAPDGTDGSSDPAPSAPEDAGGNAAPAAAGRSKGNGTDKETGTVKATSPSPSETPPAAEVQVDPQLEVATRGNVPPLTPPPGVTANFAVNGSPAGLFLPGDSRPVDVTIANPHASDLTVTAITVAVGPSSVPACGPENLVVTQGFSGTVVVPALSTRSLSALGIPQSQWPILTMPNLDVNQDACQDATFPLTYAGTGSIPS